MLNYKRPQFFKRLGLEKEESCVSEPGHTKNYVKNKGSSNHGGGKLIERNSKIVGYHHKKDRGR